MIISAFVSALILSALIWIPYLIYEEYKIRKSIKEERKSMYHITSLKEGDAWINKELWRKYREEGYMSEYKRVSNRKERLKTF